MLGIVLPFLSAQATPGDTLKNEQNDTVLPFQITFITPMGTNGYNSLKSTNYFSMNIIAGYNGGLDGLEVGGFANVLHNDMHGSQLAGFANVVRGDIQGIQGAGFANYVHGTSSGVMAAGFTNHCMHSSKVVQAAGFSNQVMGAVQGAQLAGFANVATDSVEGGQIAGFANYAGGNSQALQAAGYFNANKGNLQGVQAAGFGNAAFDVQGAQAAGYFNVARDVEGAQVSGFFNLARKVKGAQISFINVADSFSSGAPIGFLSFVRKGYRSYSLSANELLWTEFQFKTGVKRFYNIFSVALAPVPGEDGWAFGYGVGTTLLERTKTSLSLDLIGYHVNERELFTDAANNLIKLAPSFAYHPTEGRFAIWGGPTLNLMVSSTERYDDDSPFNSQTPPYEILSDQGTYFNSKFWVGGQIGIRL